jgi:membrane protein required for colicin V production
MNYFDQNYFDIAVYVFGLFAVVGGFSAGLLRSLANILGYAVAVPVTLFAAPKVSEYLTSHAVLPQDKAVFVPFGVLLVAGFILSMVFRAMVGAMSGDAGFMDRILGALLGAARIGFLAVLVVLIFARLIPPGAEPDWYKQSKLRPVLLAAGEAGLRKLPPGIEAQIEDFKRKNGF